MSCVAETIGSSCSSATVRPSMSVTVVRSVMDAPLVRGKRIAASDLKFTGFVYGDPKWKVFVGAHRASPLTSRRGTCDVWCLQRPCPCSGMQRNGR
jgi:hypothetical protein